MKTAVLLLICGLVVLAGDGNPIVRSWLLNPAVNTSSNAALSAVLPNVHGVRVEEQSVSIESAGLSLQSLGELDANDRPPAPGAQKFEFRFPLQPHPAEGLNETPLGVVGVFLNGVPFYNPASPVSYRDQNLWHLDAVAAYRRNARADAPLLQSLLTFNRRHSPLIGFALDGYPVYGPYGDTEQRIRSSYRLRSMTRRTRLPDGTVLTASQEGPAVDVEYPLGTFVEDYEYVAGFGDLDEHNGRFVRTPEYPDGTYAYFLTSYPYLVGPSYYGATGVHGDDRAFSREGDRLRFVIRDARGRRVRFLEKVHERPIHLVIVSTDLAEFAHIHPELQDDGSYTVSYSFPHGGSYWLYADYTRPGEAQTIARYRVDMPGARVSVAEPAADFSVRMTAPPRVVTGTDLRFRFDVSADVLELYLGAWAHIMIVSADGSVFVHAHPLEADAGQKPGGKPEGLAPHSHSTVGSSPGFVETITGFRRPGLYRMWVQFQRGGKVATFPFTIRVAAAEIKTPLTRVPSGAIRIAVSARGFTPDRITLPAGKPAVLAFSRADAQNCSNEVVFLELAIRKPLPPGETVLVEVPASAARELHFACGMGMYRGSLLLVSDPDRRAPR